MVNINFISIALNYIGSLFKKNKAEKITPDTLIPAPDYIALNLPDDYNENFEKWSKIISRLTDLQPCRLKISVNHAAESIVGIAKLCEDLEFELHLSNANLSGDALAEIKKAGVSRVYITLYSNDPQIHDRLSGAGGSWEDTVESIDNAIAAKLNVCVHTPLSLHNMDYAETIEFLHGRGVRKISCGDYAAKYKGGESGALGIGLSSELLSGVLASAAVLCKIRGMKLSLPDRLDLPDGLFARLEIVKPENHMIYEITEDGALFNLEESEAPVGNIFGISFF